MLQKPLSLFITKPKGKRRKKLNNNKNNRANIYAGA
jgi:hypothetical protein